MKENGIGKFRARAFVCILITAFIVFAFSAKVLAANLVEDTAGVLSEREKQTLNALAQEVSARHNTDVAVAVVSEMDGNNIGIFAENYFLESGMGQGSERSGVLLLLSMAGRDYHLLAHGYGNTAFTDYGKDVLMEDYVLAPLAKDNYYSAFYTYIKTADEFLTKAENGEPVDRFGMSARNKFFVKLAVTILVPLIAAFIICAYFKNQMKTAKIAKTANRYIPDGGFNLTYQEDRFLYRTFTRTKIHKSEGGSGGGGGGTTVNSRGFSGKSGKF
jgi:uncharacterized protein